MFTTAPSLLSPFAVDGIHIQDGGSGFSAIMMPERQDLMDQWDRVNAAWAQATATKREAV